MTYEEELRLELKPGIDNGDIVVIEDASAIFARIDEVFTFAGSYIDWETLCNVTEEKMDPDAFESSCYRFFKQICGSKVADEKLYYINDSAFDMGLSMSIKTAIEAFPKIIDLPQHHYFVAENFTWCMCFNMLGLANYGELGKPGHSPLSA